MAANFSKLKLFSEDQNLPTITPPPTTATTDVPIVGRIYLVSKLIIYQNDTNNLSINLVPEKRNFFT